MPTQVCSDLLKLAEEVHAISVVVERLKVVDQGHDKLLESHQEWLSNHQVLMERMAVSEADRKMLHEGMASLSGELRAGFVTMRWAVGVIAVMLAAMVPVAVRVIEHVFGGK